jgi:hypothetical protein
MRTRRCSPPPSIDHHDCALAGTNVILTNRLKDIRDFMPDVRDGLTREERVVLWVLHETQKERGGRNVPTAMLWGRVCEHIDISPDELSALLARLGARKDLP